MELVADRLLEVVICDRRKASAAVDVHVRTWQEKHGYRLLSGGDMVCYRQLQHDYEQTLVVIAPDPESQGLVVFGWRELTQIQLLASECILPLNQDRLFQCPY